MADAFDEPDGATLLAAEERHGLIPAHITYRSELNDAEQENILRGQDWALGRRRDWATETAVRELHRRMLGDVWSWAGKYRRSDKNLGCPFYEIPVAVRQALGDVQTWIAWQSFEPDEIAVRFSHALVKVHPFPNGNGRHSRLIGDLLAMQLGRRRFTWGRTNLQNLAEARARYIDALRAADSHDYAPLVAFARS